MYTTNNPNKPEYRPSKTTLEYPNGTKVLFISSESGPDAVRGSQCEILFLDEFVFYDKADEIITQALLTCRLGMSKVVAATTPIAAEPLISWLNRSRQIDDKFVAFVTGSTLDNTDNLSDVFIDTTISKYKGTSLWSQEILGELILENSEALFKQSTIDRNKFGDDNFPDLVSVSIGIDPALTSRKTASKGRTPDSTGIIVSGIDGDGILYVLEDHTLSAPVERWVNQIIALHDKWSQLYPTSILTESNAGGSELLNSAFDKARRGFHNNIKYTFSTTDKMQRMLPYSLLAEQGKVKFADSGLDELFTEMISYVGKGKSPNRYDALVFSFMLLKPHRRKVSVVKELLM